MKTIKGDLIELALLGKFEVIIHGCNCFCIMDAGIAKQIRRNFPAAYEIDRATNRGDKAKLGTISHAVIGNLIVINAYTQFNLGKDFNYDAITNCFKEIKRQFSGKIIGYPKISAGIAGGDWDVISKIIDTELAGEDHTLVEYESSGLPNKV